MLKFDFDKVNKVNDSVVLKIEQIVVLPSTTVLEITLLVYLFQAVVLLVVLLIFLCPLLPRRLIPHLLPLHHLWLLIHLHNVLWSLL